MPGKRKTDSDGNAIGQSRPKTDKVRAADTREFKGWVNVHLDDKQKLAFDTWWQNQDFNAMLDRLVNSAYRLSVYWDDYNETYAASLTCWNPTTDQCGYSLSMRGSDSITAIWRVLYTHYQVCQENWGAWMIRGKKQDW